MSKLDKDILFLIFEELQEDSKSLFSYLMVNRLWCETVIPILWRNPWCYYCFNYKYENTLFNIIFYYLFDDIKDFITNQEIQFPSSSLLFDYLSFCRSIDVNTINRIISFGSSSAYNQFFMQQKFYSLIMKKCPELKYFDMRSIKHQLFYIPEAKSCFESLCELRCDTSIHYSYFYGLSSFCQNIQKISIVNIEPKPNDGIAKLIEVQKNLKHFDWFDELSDEYPSEDPYKDILLALEKKADSLNYLRIYFQDSLEIKTLQKILPRFYKLKTLILDEYLRLTEEQLGQLRKQAYHDLETLNLEWNGLNVFSNIIENSGRCLKKILFRPYDTIQCDIYCFNESSLNFIRKVYENCPYIKYLSIVFPPSNEHFSEFEKLLKICQNLKSLLITIRNAGKKEANKKKFENGKTLLEILIKLAPNNLKEIRFYDDFKFSLENLEEFFERWRGREALSIFTSDSIYKRENYKALINKYISEGVIKDFIYESYKVDIYFNI